MKRRKNKVSDSDCMGTGLLATLKFKLLNQVDQQEIGFKETDLTGNICNHEIENVPVEIANGQLREGTRLSGDTNSDGTVDLRDALMVTRYYAGWKDYQNIDTSAADLNNDGKITAYDVMALDRYLVGWAGFENVANKLMF